MPLELTPREPMKGRHASPGVPSRILGKYRLLQEVGRGAVGVVYRSEDILKGETVAVKLIEPHSPSEEDTYSRLFFNEVRASGMLRHPGIVPLLDAGREGPSYYVVTEFVAGSRTLEAACSAAAGLSVEETLELGLDCAEALHYAHGKGVIHRDIKPGNVLVDRRGRARLADFGVAVLGEAGLADTSPFAAAGSPLYMAPEQISHGAVTPATDLFALGLMLYQLLSGRHPFAARSLAAVARRLVEEEPPPLDRVRGDLPSGLSGLIARTLSKDPADRPASGLELARSLSTLLGGVRQPLEGLVAEGRADQLRRLDFFRGFDEAELWELLRWSRWEEVAGGTEVVTEGEAGDSFYVIVDGGAVVRKAGVDVAVLGQGACFGEISYLSTRPRSASVTTTRAASLLRVNDALLKNASSRCQMAFQRVFIGVLIERLVATTEVLTRGQ